MNTPSFLLALDGLAAGCLSARLAAQDIVYIDLFKRAWYEQNTAGDPVLIPLAEDPFDVSATAYLSSEILNDEFALIFINGMSFRTPGRPLAIHGASSLGSNWGVLQTSTPASSPATVIVPRTTLGHQQYLRASQEQPPAGWRRSRGSSPSRASMMGPILPRFRLSTPTCAGIFPMHEKADSSE